MEFKSSDAVFKDKNCFVDDMKRFMCDEAARFTTGGNEAASASIDEFAERGVRFSIEKNKRAIKQQKQAIKELDAKKEELLKTEMESIHPSEKEVSGGDSSSSYSSSEKDSKENKESSSHQASEKEKELDSKKEKAKKEKSKEAKKAGAKTAVANLLKAKAEMSNDLVGNKVTGDALKDGNTGMMKLLTHALNPMTYMKKLVAYIGAAIAPYILAFMAIASVVLIIVMFIFSILQPLQEIGNAIQSAGQLMGQAIALHGHGIGSCRKGNHQCFLLLTHQGFTTRSAPVSFSTMEYMLVTSPTRSLSPRP